VLTQKNDKAVLGLLSRYKQEAERNAAKAILLSNEMLLGYFSEEEQAVRFKEHCEALGISLQPMLLVLREPVDQALSLYKHRAKNGNIAGVEYWLKEGYHLDKVLDKFMASQLSPNVDCSYRKYDKNSSYLVDVVFKDWLRLEVMPKWEDRKVNPSLTLSELVILKQVRRAYPELTKILYQRFLALPAAQKSDDPYLTQYYRDCIQLHLYESRSVWAKCNERLRPSEQLKYPAEKLSIVGKTEKLSFFPEQTAALVQLLQDNRKISFKAMMLWRKIRPFLARIKWGILNTINPR
jgi:hypothetical protein